MWRFSFAMDCRSKPSATGSQALPFPSLGDEAGSLIGRSASIFSISERLCCAQNALCRSAISRPEPNTEVLKRGSAVHARVMHSGTMRPELPTKHQDQRIFNIRVDGGYGQSTIQGRHVGNGLPAVGRCHQYPAANTHRIRSPDRLISHQA